MDINQILIPETKKISFTDVFEDAWELCMSNLLTFSIYLLIWVIVDMLSLAFPLLILIFVSSHMQNLSEKDFFSLFEPYIKIFDFFAFTFCLSAFLRTAILRYEGEEFKHWTVIKQTAKDYLKYFFIILVYASICLAGFKLITDSYWLSFIRDYRMRLGTNFILLIPVFYLAARYFLCLTAAIVNPSRRSAFKTSAYLMKNNYRAGIFLILLISSMIYLIMAIGKIVDLIYIAEVTIMLGSLLIISINIVYYKKLEALKELSADTPMLRKRHPLAGLLFAVAISLIPLWILFPEVPRKIFYRNDFLLGAFSQKITFHNGMSFKRPSGSFVEEYPHVRNVKIKDIYLISKLSNKMIPWFDIKLMPLKRNISFRKDLLNLQEKNQLKNILNRNVDNYDCAYKITETFQELNNPQEYPKGIYIYTKRSEEKEYTYEGTDTYFYRVIDNKYLCVGQYSHSVVRNTTKEKKYKETTPEELSALEKERKEADAYLKYWVCDVHSP